MFSTIMGSSNELFRIAVEACPAAMILVADDGAIVLANAECGRIFGYSPGELVGLSVDALVPAEARGTHAGRRHAFFVEPSKRRMGEGRDLSALRKDGSTFPVEIGLTPVVAAGRVGVLAFIIDISERRRAAERERLYAAELERANKSLAQFAYVASHDIQEPLRKIAAFSDLLATAIASDDRQEMLMAGEVMRTSAQRARRLVRDVLTLAQSMNEAYDVAWVSVRTLVDEALQALSQTIEESGARMSVEVEDMIVLADRVQGVRVMQNLISNALKFHKPGRPPAVAIHTERNDRGERRLVVEDEGVGFDPAHREEIFQAFRRLHRREEFAGSGIGLAICRAVADRLGWTLTPSSRVGVGSRFEILFSEGEDAARARQ
jgi:PAS domain S-box-containing protein